MIFTPEARSKNASHQGRQSNYINSKKLLFLSKKSPKNYKFWKRGGRAETEKATHRDRQQAPNRAGKNRNKLSLNDWVHFEPNIQLWSH